MDSSRQLILLLAVAGLTLTPVYAEHHRRPVTVSPSDELQIIPPNVDSLGKPRVVMVPQGASGLLDIEVPPTVILHRYYYTGDRNFQAQMLPGGPTVVVARHPRSGEQIAIEAQLLPGAPRVYYTRNEIRYVYKEKTIAIHFGIEPFTDTKVVVCDHQVKSFAKGTTHKVSSSISGWLKRTGVPGAVASVDGHAKEGVGAVADRVHDLGEIAVRPVVYLWESTPISGLLTPNTPCRSSEFGGITDELDGTIPTNR